MSEFYRCITYERPSNYFKRMREATIVLTMSHAKLQSLYDALDALEEGGGAGGSTGWAAVDSSEQDDDVTTTNSMRLMLEVSQRRAWIEIDRQRERQQRERERERARMIERARSE